MEIETTTVINNTNKSRLEIRQSNIELLRIIAMVLIIAFHFAHYGNFEHTVGDVGVNSLWNIFLLMGGKIGVDIFVIISGYFLVKSKGYKISKLIKFWLQLFTYSIIIYCVFVWTGLLKFSYKGVLAALFPIISNKWWFASTYFVLLFISPFINKLLFALNQREYVGMLLGLTILWCIVPTFTNISIQYSNLAWFIYLYILIGYVKIYNINTNISASKYILYGCIIVLITYVVVIGMDLAGINIYESSKKIYLFEMNRLPILLISIFLFLGFLKIKINSNKIINLIASTTFGIYLIHDNKYVREYIWKVLFNNTYYINSKYLILYTIVVVAIVFIFCMIVEMARIYLIEKRYIKYIDILANKIDNIFKKLICYIIRK